MGDNNLHLIEGYKRLETHFGYMPTFHDFEVVSITCDRAGPRVELIINGFRTTNEVEGREYVQRNHCQITLSVSGLRDLQLSDFNHQNVLQDLSVEHATNGVRVSLRSSFGLQGHITGDRVQVQSIIATL